MGGRLGQYLQKEGFNIVLGSRLAHDELPRWLPQAETICIDWANPTSIKNACNGVDVIIHAAGMNAKDCEANPSAALDFNGVATARLVDAAAKTKVLKLIYLSTAHVYTNPLEGRISEGSDTINPHPYATSHVAGENAVLSNVQNQGVVIRLSNVFGAPTNKDVNCWMLLVNDLCRQAIETKKIKLLSNGMQYRDFIGMDRACSFIRIILSNSLFADNKRIFNLGEGVSRTVLEMAEIIQARCEVILGYKPELSIGRGDERKYAPLEYISENIKIEKLLLQSKTMINELDELIIFCNNNFKYKNN